MPIFADPSGFGEENRKVNLDQFRDARESTGRLFYVVPDLVDLPVGLRVDIDDDSYHGLSQISMRSNKPVPGLASSSAIHGPPCSDASQGHGLTDTTLRQ